MTKPLVRTEIGQAMAEYFARLKKAGVLTDTKITPKRLTRRWERAAASSITSIYLSELSFGDQDGMDGGDGATQNQTPLTPAVRIVR